MTWNPTPAQRARFEARQRVARRMRAEGKSYEQIAEALSGPDAYCLLGDTYSLARPEKSPEQTVRRKMKHAITAAEDARWNAWLEKYHPEDFLDDDYDDAA
jgi:hypothetical protein